MSLNTYYEVWRWLGVSLAAISLLTCSKYYWVHRKEIVSDQWFRFASLMFFCLGLIFTTVQLTIVGVNPGPRNIVGCFGPVLMILGTTKPRFTWIKKLTVHEREVRDG